MATDEGSEHARRAGREVTARRIRKRPAAALDLDALTSIMGVHLRLANVALYHDFLEEVGSLDITQSQSAVLILIGNNRGVSQVVLAEFLGINRATMMSMVDRLEAGDLVERRAMAGDRRLRGLYLTAKGRKTLIELRKRIARHERKMFASFSPSELKQFAEYLSRVHGKL